jgi:CRP/FNR family cyclic AMP-dependent transcriptional regulator
MDLNASQSIFAQTPSLERLPEEARQRLERVAEQRQYRRRQVVYFADQPGDYVYLLLSGRVKIARVSDQGREVTLYLVEPGQLFGEDSLMEANRPYGVMAETLEDSRVYAFRRSDFLEVFQEAPPALMELIRIVNERRATAETKIADLVFLDVPKRLVKLLLSLYDQTEQRDDGMIPSKYTHQELANLIGSTRETTTLVLNELRRQGSIAFLGRKIIIRKRDALEALLVRREASSALPA